MQRKRNGKQEILNNYNKNKRKKQKRTNDIYNKTTNYCNNGP